MVRASPARCSAAVSVMCLATLSLACGREERFVSGQLAALPGVAHVETVACDFTWHVPSTGICATVTMNSGAVLRFAGLKLDSFGPVPTRVRVIEAGGRVPVIVSCTAQAAVADVDRSGLFGHHFTPAMDGIAEAIRRHRDVIEELEFWPQCPQFWELQEEQGPRYRYCAHAARATVEPPPPFCG